jgi:hypothetical protein
MFTKSHALIIAKDYWGTQMAIPTAEMYIRFLNDNLFVSIENTNVIVGDNVSQSSVLFNYNNILQNLKEPDTLVIIVMIGHGNQINDNNGDEIDGRDEIYQLPNGNITDDQLTNSINSINMSDSSLCVLISDHCSSGTMLDSQSANKGVNWVNIASSLDYEDSYSSGEGNVMSYCLINMLTRELKDHNLHTITIADIREKLDNEMKSSFIGDLQHSCVSVSNDNVLRVKLFDVNT